MPAKLTIETRGDREVVIIRAFNAPRDMVFEAHTKPALLRRWLLGPGDWTMPVCEIDLRVGGSYRYVWRHADGREMGMGGVYREIVAPERIVTTELFDEDWTNGEAVTTLVLTAKGGRTTAVSTVLYSSRAARDAVLKTPMADGMEAGYARLDELLAQHG
ncbi:MAG: SRPBCC family protein [Alphaproteobacteria bacterium]|jgi:uncharacterized protein YndB with AHSA1/START domain|nr:SRPBCC family protein [Alphaproteobacteria bacterium]